MSSIATVGCWTGACSPRRAERLGGCAVSLVLDTLLMWDSRIVDTGFQESYNSHMGVHLMGHSLSASKPTRERVGHQVQDDPSTAIDERATEASNVGSHEAGHASDAKLEHNVPNDSSVMDFPYSLEDWGKERKDFNSANSAKLREAYNKKEEKK